MKTSQEYLDLSKERLLCARHILEVTYPKLRSPRLFLSCLEHLFLSMDYAMNSVLADDKLKAKAGEHPQTFSGRYSAFRLRLASSLGFERRGIEALLAMRNTLILHKKSPMEFERNDRFIICTNDYEMTHLSLEGMGSYIEIASSFLESARDVLEQPLSTQGDSHSP